MTMLKVRKLMSGVGLKTEAGIRKTALSFPSSLMLPSELRGSLKLALQATTKYGWPGLGDKSGWSSDTYYDHQEYSLELDGISETAYEQWLQECPGSDVLPLPLSNVPRETLEVILEYAASSPIGPLLLPWLAKVPPPGSFVVERTGIWCEDWQGISRDAKRWYCSQLLGIRKLKDRSGAVGRPALGRAVGSVWTPGWMLPMTWMVPSEAELEALLAAGEAWKWYHDPEGNIIAYAPGYDHIGDIDWVSKGRLGAMNPLWNEPGGHQGYVFASMEEDGPKHPTGMVAAFYDNMQDEANAYDGVFRWGSSPLFPGFDADTFKVDGILRPQHHCPWCAINPWDGLLYTSPFNPPYDASQDISYLYRFDIHNRTVLTLQELRALAFPLHVVRFLGGQTATSLPVFAFAGVFPIKGHLTRIQGGSFSTDGSLFLASDGEDSEEAPNPGLWRISMLTGQVLDKVGINREYDPYSKWYRDWESQEVEGVCLSGGSQGSGSGPGSDGQDRYLCTGVWWWKGGGGNDWVFLKARRVP